MGDSSRIEWTDATWNPVVGCTHVSPGCDHCYAARDASGRLSRLPLYAGLAERGRFTGEVRLVPERLEHPLRWLRPRMVFVNSMSDLFHQDVPPEFIAQVFAVMAVARWHTFQVLTKRAARMRAVLNAPRFQVLVDHHMAELLDDEPTVVWPLPNVWLGVSVEDQARADQRAPLLLDTPAAVRFLSAEPLLGPLDLTEWVLMRAHHPAPGGPIGWVIVGGESGRGARPMHPEWARSLRDECQAAGVPFFFKQWGEYRPTDRCSHLDPIPYRPGADPYPLGWVERVGKKAAGRELDGRTWDEMPERAVTPS